MLSYGGVDDLVIGFLVGGGDFRNRVLAGVDNFVIVFLGTIHFPSAGGA